MNGYFVASATLILMDVTIAAAFSPTLIDYLRSWPKTVDRVLEFLAAVFLGLILVLLLPGLACISFYLGAIPQ